MPEEGESIMSARAVEKVRHPEGLTLPSREKIEEIRPFLTPEGRVRFLDEILDALVSAKETGDLAHVNHVVEAWYRTLLFRKDTEHDDRWDQAQQAEDEDLMDIDEVNRRLKLV